VDIEDEKIIGMVLKYYLNTKNNDIMYNRGSLGKKKKKNRVIII